MSLQAADRQQMWVNIYNAGRAKALAIKPRPIESTSLERRQAWIDTVVRTGPTHAVTLIWNPEDGKLSADRVHADTAAMHCRVDRALMGKRFNKLPSDQRTGYVGFIEHPDANMHAHLAWRVPSDHHHHFALTFRKWWDRLHPYGDLDVQVIYDPHGRAAYMIKDQWRFNGAENAALLLKSRT